MSKIAHWHFDVAPTNGVIYDELNAASGLIATWNTTPPAITTEYGKQGVRVNGTQWGIISGSKTFNPAYGVSIVANIILDNIDQNWAQILGLNNGSNNSETDTAIFCAFPNAAAFAVGMGKIYSCWKVAGNDFASKSNDVTQSSKLTQLATAIKTGANKILIDSADTALVYSTLGIPASITMTSGRLLRSLWSYDGAIKGFVIDIALYDHAITDKELCDLMGASAKNFAAQTLVLANPETRISAWPGENSCKQMASQTAKKSYGVTTSSMLNAPPLRKDFGFIEGVITRKKVSAVGQHVICLDDRFNLVAETFSAVGGHYRFDSLPINGLYAIHAYDNNEYKYAPVGADRRTPEAYS